MNYGDKRDYKPIEIYHNGNYVCTTTWSKTLKQAKEKFIESHGIVNSNDVKCYFK